MKYTLKLYALVLIRFGGFMLTAVIFRWLTGCTNADARNAFWIAVAIGVLLDLTAIRYPDSKDAKR